MPDLFSIYGFAGLDDPAVVAQPTPPKSPGALGHIADTSLQLAQGVLQGGEMLSNAFGADNPVSEKLRAGHQWLASNFSDQLKWEQLTTAREMDEAAKTGSTWDEVKAAARGFGRDPVGFLVNAAGTSLPTIAAAFLPGGQGALLGRLAAMGAAGAAQGAGAVKGQIFGEVEQAWKEAGATEEEAKTRAAAAQEYLGSNAGQIAIGTALGAVAGATGLEGGLAAKVGGQAAAKTTGMIPRFVREGVKEAIPEAAQGGQEQLAGNLAVQGEGFERSTWGGVAGGATLEGLAGGIVGASGSVFTKRSAADQAMERLATSNDIDEITSAAVQAVDTPLAGPNSLMGLNLPDTEVTPEQAIMRMEAEAQRDSRLNVSDWSALGGERMPVEPEADWMREARATAEADQQQMADEQRIRAEALAPAPARQMLPDLPGGRTWERDMAGITLDAEAARTEQQKAADLERLPADAAAQNLQQQALQRAAALEGESPMAAALRKAGAARPPEPQQAGAGAAPEPGLAGAQAAPVPGNPGSEPRIVPRTPAMEPMSLPRAQETAAKVPGSEVVAIRNRSGKLAYTVLPPEQAAIRPGDILTQDQYPYGTKTAATIRARKEGPEWRAVEVPGGFAVRRQGDPAAEVAPSTQPAAPAAAGPAGFTFNAAQPAPQPQQGRTPTEATGEAAPIEGQKIDREWTAFAADSGTLSIPRADMPQIRAEHRGAMVNFLNARGIEHESTEVPAGELKPTQAEFSPAKVKKAREFTGGDRSILVSGDGHVLDGHHQWMAKRESGEPIKVIRLKAPIKRLLAEVREFPSAQASDGAATQQPKAAPNASEIGPADSPPATSNPTVRFEPTDGASLTATPAGSSPGLRDRIERMRSRNGPRERPAELIALLKRRAGLANLVNCLGAP